MRDSPHELQLQVSNRNNSGIKGKYHAVSLNNGRKHTNILRNVNDLGFWSMILSSLLT